MEDTLTDAINSIDTSKLTAKQRRSFIKSVESGTEPKELIAQYNRYLDEKSNTPSNVKSGTNSEFSAPNTEVTKSSDDEKSRSEIDPSMKYVKGSDEEEPKTFMNSIGSANTDTMITTPACSAEKVRKYRKKIWMIL